MGAHVPGPGVRDRPGSEPGRKRGRGRGDGVELRPVRRDLRQGRPAPRRGGRLGPRVSVDVIGVEDVVAASEAIGTRLHRTPILSSAGLGKASGGSVYLKAELFQRTGSFKVRGVLAKLASLSAAEKERGVITISAGNHAGAVAYGCALEGIDALVVTWAGASAQKIAATRVYGAEVDQEAATAGEAFTRMEELREQSGRTLVHPFDDPFVLAGQGTIGLEILEDRPDVGVVVVPAGGGGLVAGIGVAVKAIRPDVRLVAVEPEGSAV